MSVKVKYKGPLKRQPCRFCHGTRFSSHGKLCQECRGAGSLLLRVLLPVTVFEEKSFTPAYKIGRK